MSVIMWLTYIIASADRDFTAFTVMHLSDIR
jgi:hypothetical protein